VPRRVVRPLQGGRRDPLRCSLPQHGRGRPAEEGQRPLARRRPGYHEAVHPIFVRPQQPAVRVARRSAWSVSVANTRPRYWHSVERSI